MADVKREHIGSIVKAFTALTAIANRPGAVSAKDLSQELGTPLPTTYHLLKTLIAEGAVVRGPDKGYRLGPRIGVLGDAYLEDGEPIWQLSMPLNSLAAATGETAYLSAWRQGEIEVVATAEGSHAVRVAQLQRGAHGMAHARASGKLLLAYARPGLRARYLQDHPLERQTPNTITDLDRLAAEFDRIRQQGYSTDLEEFCEGVSCMSAPVLAGSRIMAAFTVSSPSPRFEATRADLLRALREACARAAELLTPTGGER